MWLYNKLSDVQKKLLSKGIIDLQGLVDDDMAFYVREAIMRLMTKEKPPDIEVIITSDGGDVGIGLDIFDFIRTYPGRKVGKLMSHARSISVIILQACDERVVMRHCKLFIHHISRRSISLDQLRSKKQMRELHREMERDQNRLYEIISQKTGKSRKIISRKCREENDMTSEEALEFGLIDKII